MEKGFHSYTICDRFQYAENCLVQDLSRSAAATAIGLVHHQVGSYSVRFPCGWTHPLGRIDSCQEVLKSIPGTKTTNDVMIIVFTCKGCGTRAARKMSKEAYNHGVVLIRCPGCNNLHLIADHLGYFDDNSTNVEQILAQKGEKVMRMDDKQVLEFLHKEDLK